MSPLHSWARYYASLGWKVFPLVPGTKSPFKDSAGSSEATSDPVQIDAWWSAHPEANIGTRPSAAGLYVFDVDPRNGGDVSAMALALQHGPLVTPLRVRSPGGGWHDYLAARPGARYVGSPAPGIDGKYNGYAVLPPSLHPNGGRYEWANGHPDASSVAAPAPVWLERAERVKGDVPALQRTGNLGDVELIRQALELRDPESYESWSMAIASLRHWEDTTDGADGIGYELAREWSERSAKHDDGVFDDKWAAWDSDKAGGRTLGSLLHESGLTREQMMPSAADVFGAVPAVIPEIVAQPLQWSTVPVDGFKGTTEPSMILAELIENNYRGFAERWHAADSASLINDLGYRCGGCAELVLQVLLQCPGIEDSEHLRAQIAYDCTHRTTWYTIGALTPEQQSTATSGLMARVEVDDGKLVHAQRLIDAALPAVPGVFQRSGKLVRVVRDGKISEFSLQNFSRTVETYLRLEKGGKGTPAKCPDALAKRVLEAGEWPGVEELVAAVPYPVVRADGSVIGAAGMDALTGLYVRYGLSREPRVLNLDECREAFARAWAPFAEFPYASAIDRGVAVSALLSCVCRASLDAAPAYLVRAQTPGTGKSLLCDALVMLSGAGPGGRALSSKGEEQSKQLTSIFRAAPTGFYFDNYFGTLRGGSEFCMALTTPMYRARLLGGNDELEVPNRSLVLLNGNNVGLQGDVVRRFLTIGLNSADGLSRKQHAFDPKTVVRQGLQGLRADLIDLLVTFKACAPDWRPADGLPSFEDWNKLVRGCVLWLSGFVESVELRDPLEALAIAQEDDPDSVAHKLMLAAWEERFGDRALSLRELQDAPLDPAQHPLWLEAYDAIATDSGGKENHKRLQYFLRDKRDVVVDGMWFCGERDRMNRILWSVKR